jgi:HNH endonuclease
MRPSRELEAKVRAKANERCEYCLMHQALQGASFHIEHVIPRCVGGNSGLSNLALACPGCNLHKADRVEAVDEETGKTVPFFNPRADPWDQHFRFDRYSVVGLTPIGRATIRALNLNHPRRVQIRKAEALFGLFAAAE